MHPLLSLRRASKTYGDTPVLIDAALDLLPGRVHALMGENGAGKSTLIKILAGVVTADSAEILVGGQPTVIASPQAAFDAGLRFIHQELNIVSQLSVAENLFIGQPYPRRAGLLVDWRRLADEARLGLGQLGIRHIDPREGMARLSVGDQMLVRIASAFLNVGGKPASVYVMDEPTAALTSDETARLFAAIGQLKAQGAAVLYVSHRMEEIFRIGDEVTVMRDGRVVATRSIADTTSQELIRLMTGRELTQAYPARTTPIGEKVRLQVRGVRTAQVEHADFDMQLGEILGVAGLAGAGRTELLRALAGADRLLAGSILLDDTALGRGLTRAWREGVAYIPEERRAQGLLLSRSIRDNITLPHLNTVSHGGLLLDPRREARESAALGASVRLKATGVRQTTRELSGGNQQKVLFARSMARSPRLLLLDEPTRGVDVGAKYDIYTLIRQMSAQGIAIVLVSSDLGELIGLCDRVLVMRARRQMALASTNGLTQHDLLTLCYGDH